MRIKIYQDLLFWKKSVEVSKLIINLSSGLNKTKANQIIKSQILRSSMSVGAMLKVMEDLDQRNLKDIYKLH